MRNLDPSAKRFVLSTLAIFALCAIVSVPLMVYFANTNASTSCEVLGTKITTITCRDMSKCKYIERYENVTGTYYLCVCYASYIDVLYGTHKNPTLGSMRIQSGIIDMESALKYLREKYPKDKVFPCYYNKFNVTEVYAEYDNIWIGFLVMDLVICLFVSVIFTIANEVRMLRKEEEDKKKLIRINYVTHAA
jgi:hypothetical protein